MTGKCACHSVTLQQHFTPAFEDGTDRVFRNVGIYKSDAGESPKRKRTTCSINPQQLCHARSLPDAFQFLIHR